MKKIIITGIFISLLCVFFVLFYYSFLVSPPANLNNSPIVSATPEVTSSPMIALPTKEPLTIPLRKVLQNDYHIFQTFNNCGPASLSMALSYFGIQKSQAELGKALRPYQVAGGNNDDKSVGLDELARKAEEFGLVAYHRPNGSIESLKYFIANDIPIITVTWLKPDEDIGHYRVIKGYDDDTQTLIQDDSYQNKNLKYTYEDFNTIWEKFNYEYLVLVPDEKKELAQRILDQEIDEKVSWKNAADNARKKLVSNPDETYTRFNLVVALYHTGDYAAAVKEYEKIENDLPFRTLWYQIEPIEAYYELGDYDKVLSITDTVLNNQNRAFSELYIIRGNIYLKRGDTVSAKKEFEKAVLYNSNLKEAKDALASI
jgi:predicted double-glycine peptidase